MPELEDSSGEPQKTPPNAGEAAVQSGFSSIASRFDRNIRALRVFAQTIALHADAHDQQAVRSFMEAINAILPKPQPGDEKGIAGSAEGDDAGKRDARSESAKDASPIPPVVHEALKDANVRKRFFGAVKAMTRAAPIQGSILRASALISLMSHIEALIAELIHLYYAKYPSALPAEERTITLADLRVLGSVADAEKLLVSKEVDSVLRESLENQLQYFAKRGKVDLAELNSFASALIEIDQRRNLLVHNRGIVNRTYLTRVDSGLVASFGAKEGEELRISPEYLAKALDLVEICGTILTQLCWRRWAKADAAAADTTLTNETLYESLLEARYDVVIRVAAFALRIGVTTDATARIVCINKAIAHRELADLEAVRETLGTLDWSACSLRYRVAVQAVRGDTDECFKLIPTAVAAKELGQADLEEWPLFANMRLLPRWQAEIVPLFHK